MTKNKQAAAILLGPLVNLLRERGLDAAAIFARHGLSLDTVRDPEAQLDADVSTRLLDDCRQQLDDPSMGIEVARHAQYNTFGALGVALAAGGDLHSVLTRITRFHRLISDLVRTELTVSQNRVELHFHSSTDHEPHPQAIAFVMASIVRLLRIRIDPQHDPVAACAPAWVEPGLKDAMRRYLRCPLTLADNYTLVFDKANASRMLAASDAQLADMLDAALAQRVARLEQAGLATTLSLWIEERLPEGEPAQSDAAAALCMSARSLQRRLREEGLSWKQLLDDTRRSLAERYLRTPGMSVTQVAFLSGFSDVSAFSRAFKKWHGVAPSRYR